MADDPIQAGEKRGYARGYTAGRKRKARDISEAERQRKSDALWNRAFLAALPSCIEVTGWKSGDKPINDVPRRTWLAAQFADEALKYMRNPE